jgi:hypothetical protein
MATRSIVGDILNLVGITGSGGSTNSLTPRSSSPEGRMQALTDFRRDDAVSNPDIWSFYNTSMRNPQTFEDMLRLWEDMSVWDLLAAALNEVVEEAVQPDSFSPSTIWYECNDTAVADELNDMLELINAETILPSQVWHVAALGNHFEKIHYTQGEGVQGLSFVHPADVRRYWLARNRRCVGFRWLKNPPDKSSLFRADTQTSAISRNSINTGSNVEELWYPWDFLHFRRMHRMRMSEHGEPIFSESQGIYKKLRMALDQMVVHRAQVQPDRYVVNIDTQEQPPAEQMRTVQRWKQSMRSKLAFGQGDANSQGISDPSDFKSYYNAMALDTVFWMAKPKGVTHTIEKLAGTPTVPDVYDIEMLINLFFSIIGMPRSWIGAGGSGDGEKASSGKALLAQDIRFYRKVKGIRRPIIDGYTWLAYFHLTLKGRDISNLDVRARMSDIGSLDDQMRMEMLEKQIDVLNKLGDVIEKYKLPKEAWLELIFKKYMHLPDDIVHSFMTSLPVESEQKLESRSRLGKDAPREARLLQEVQECLNKQGIKHSRESMKELAQMLCTHNKAPQRGKRKLWESGDQNYQTFEARSRPQSNDLIVSSYDSIEGLGTHIQKADAATKPTLNESIRKWSPLA